MKRASIITFVPAPSILSLTRARPRDPTPDYWKSQGRNVTTIFTVWIRLSLSAIHFIVNSRIHPLCPLCCYPHQTPTDRMLVSKSMRERGRGIRESLKLNLIFPPPHSLPPRNRVDHFIRSVSYHFSQHFQSCLSTVFQTLDTFKRQYHCPSAWYVNSPPRLSSIRLSTTSFTIHFHVSKPTFLMHDSRRKSAGKGLVSPISGTDWVIRIYRRDTRFLSASDCRRYWIRFHKLHSLFPFPFCDEGGKVLPPFFDIADCSMVRSFARYGESKLCCFDKQCTEISADKVQPFQRGGKWW